MLLEFFLVHSLQKLSITELASMEESVYNYTTMTHSGYARNRVMNNVHTVRTKMIADQIFKQREGQLLSDWLRDKGQCTTGPSLEADNFDMHPGTRRRWMTDQAFSSTLHIFFTFKIPTRRFGSLMQYFSVLLLGKAYN